MGMELIKEIRTKTYGIVSQMYRVNTWSHENHKVPGELEKNFMEYIKNRAKREIYSIECIRKEERSKINYLSFHVRKLKKKRAN